MSEQHGLFFRPHADPFPFFRPDHSFFTSSETTTIDLRVVAQTPLCADVVVADDITKSIFEAAAVELAARGEHLVDRKAGHRKEGKRREEKGRASRGSEEDQTQIPILQMGVGDPFPIESSLTTAPTSRQSRHITYF